MKHADIKNILLKECLNDFICISLQKRIYMTTKAKIGYRNKTIN